jgi:hypothetical protein
MANGVMIGYGHRVGGGTYGSGGRLLGGGWFGSGN